ncbi:hypothetical protein GGI07_001701 [Coemansia sp. Benny D115]|nr:hypothetical protein GGI07_001701 [Coemansia sp. Benny D115]
MRLFILVTLVTAYLGCIVLTPANARLRTFKTRNSQQRRAIDASNTQFQVKSQSLQRLATDQSARICTSTVTNPPPMRLRQPQLCDPEVKQYSGYVDLHDDRHVFFWYFGSRTRLSPDFNPSQNKVPLVFWFSGGPGCSSQIANWQENGPCLYVPTNSSFDPTLTDTQRKALPHEVRRNPWAWNTVADIVFIDQPIGTGFSYGRVANSTEAATETAWLTMQAIYAKLQADATGRREINTQDVYIFGESYAGRYIPLFTEYLMHMNDIIAQSTDLQTRGFTELPLRGIGIGNGMYDYKLQSPTYYDIACNSSYPPLFSDIQCAYIKNVMNPRCHSRINDCYGKDPLPTSAQIMRSEKCPKPVAEPWRMFDSCKSAESACNFPLGWTTLISTYDVRPGARLVPDDYIEYLQSREFTDAIGVTDTGIPYEECSDTVFDAFGSTVDSMSRSSISSLQYILDRQLPILMYNGDADFICNWYGNLAVARALKWEGQERFRTEEPKKWTWPAKSGKDIDAGQVTAVDNLTFLRIYEAGHEVPYYQPQASLYMLAQFITNQKIH